VRGPLRVPPHSSSKVAQCLDGCLNEFHSDSGYVIYDIEGVPWGVLLLLKNENGLVAYEKIPKHVKALEEYVGELQDAGLAPSRIANYAKAIRSLYRVNGIEVRLPYALSRRSVSKDRAPRPEELQRLLDMGDLREKFVITTLALGGFREGTLVRLQYRHIREDLERGASRSMCTLRQRS